MSKFVNKNNGNTPSREVLITNTRGYRLVLITTWKLFSYINQILSAKLLVFMYKMRQKCFLNFVHEDLPMFKESAHWGLLTQFEDKFDTSCQERFFVWIIGIIKKLFLIVWLVATRERVGSIWALAVGRNVQLWDGDYAEKSYRPPIKHTFNSLTSWR